MFNTIICQRFNHHTIFSKHFRVINMTRDYATTTNFYQVPVQTIHIYISFLLQSIKHLPLTIMQSETIGRVFLRGYFCVYI